MSIYSLMQFILTVNAIIGYARFWGKERQIILSVFS